MSLRRYGATVAALLVLSGCAGAPPVMNPDPVAIPPAAPPPEPVAVPVVPSAPAPTPTPPRVFAPLRVVAVGDIMLGTDYPAQRLPPDHGAGLLQGVADILRDAEITFGNLEGVLMDGGEPFKVCQDPRLCYLFRTPSRYVENLVSAGFDVVSLANNHARDFGEEGRSATMATLDRAGILHSGRDGDIASWTVAGRNVSMIAFAPNPGSFPLLDTGRAVSLVAELAQSHDVVIVSFHGGAEGLEAMHVPHGEEFYYGESRGNLREFAHAVIDAGADLVIGHGPHVPRGMEVYRNRLVAYSLGNFATYQGISIAGDKGVAPILSVVLGPGGEFTSGRVYSARQHRPEGLLPDPQLRALGLMRSLSEVDFPGSAPVFGPDGDLTPPDSRFAGGDGKGQER